MFLSMTMEERKGFSLLELLLVIFIISLVYFLGFSGIEKSSKKPDTLSPLTIKQSIMQSPLFAGQGTFICVNKCRSCYLRKDISSPFEPYEGAVNLPDIKVYSIDVTDNLVPKEYGRYQDHPICLRIDFYPNGSSTPLIVETEKGIYYLPAYLGKPQKVDSLEKAKELWLAHDHDLDNRGDYY